VPDEDPIAHRYRLLKPHLTDDELRLWAAAEASVGGPDATALLVRLTGIPEAEIQRSLQQIKARAKTDPERSSS
jgi:cytochrome c553